VARGKEERGLCGCGRRRKRASMSDNIMFQFLKRVAAIGGV